MIATLIFGLGSAHGDDQLGWRVIELLAASLDAEAAADSTSRIAHRHEADFVRSPAVAGGSSQNSHEICYTGILLKCGTSPAALLDSLDGIERLIVCDACRSANSLGDIQTWRWPQAPLASLRSSGSHDVDLEKVFHLAELLGCLPAEVLIFAAPITSVAALAPLSALAQEAAERIASNIHALVR